MSALTDPRNGRENFVPYTLAMDHLSFASAYRTAAILAAFSQASIGADAPSPGRGSAYACVAPTRRTAFAVLGAWLRPRPSSAAEPNRPGWIRKGASRPARQTAPALGATPLVSHFAFCEIAPSWDDPRLG